MSRPDEYKHLAEWGRMMGSYDYYIEDQQEQAAQDGAPIDAVYRTSNGKWERFADVTNQDTVNYFEKHGFKQ